MYFNFRTTDKLGAPRVIDARGCVFSDEPIAGMEHIIVEDHSELFTQAEDGRFVPTGFIEGWENFPTKQLDESGSIVDFDPYSCEALAHWWRRDHVIQEDLGKDIKPGTELKKLRRALKAVIAALPELAEHEDIQAFLGYSESIEGVIARHPKSEKLNLREINGTMEEVKDVAD